MIKLVACIMFVLIAAEPSPAGPDYDELLRRALQYGDTPARRAEKEAARKELDALGADALRAMVDRMHMENLMLHVVAHEFVERQVPAAEGIPVLRSGLDSPHEQTRRACAFLLGLYPRDDESIPRLLRMLDVERERNAALRTLGLWRVEEAHARARGLLAADAERTRIAAANALARFRSRADIDALLDALGDSSILVRNAAARALLEIGAPAKPSVRRAIRRAEGARLRELIRLAGIWRDRAAKRDLARLSRHPDPQIRADARWALSRIDRSQPPRDRLVDPQFYGRIR
ncbi:MAG: HEAT repeat domain-containing protein [Kiritimatiellae bacterium]|nr:HEAT repeat domain-containing protein [Kiritimatiellia bacterium]MDW8457576.1 HEAT repeat domain-containing protein [Verrucomicrobiota bacterium]